MGADAVWETARPARPDDSVNVQNTSRFIPPDGKRLRKQWCVWGGEKSLISGPDSHLLLQAGSVHSTRSKIAEKVNQWSMNKFPLHKRFKYPLENVV